MIFFRKLTHRALICIRLSFINRSLRHPLHVVMSHESSTNISNLNHGLNSFPHNFSTMIGNILLQARDIGKLHEEIEYAINEHRLSDAWDLHEQHMKMEGFARKSVVTKLIAALTESMDIHWVEKAYGLVEISFAEHKHTFFDKEILMYLSLALAKCGLPIPASTILRKLVEMENYPPEIAWSAVIAYMSENSSGSYLAVELVLEIGYLFQDGRVDPRKKCNRPLISMKPSTTTFNIALAGCLLFGTTRKAEQLLDMMPRINMKIDATLLIMMAHIFERNGRKNELSKLKRHFEEIHNVSDMQLRQFYNCLLSCHMKFGDLDSASQMVLEMLCKAKRAQNSLGVANLMFDADNRNITPSYSKSDLAGNPVVVQVQQHVLSYEKFLRDRKFSRLEAEAKEVLNRMIVKLNSQVELITSERGIFTPSEITFQKLIKAFLEANKIKDLVEFLIKAEKEDCPLSTDDSALVHVINSCISLGWLDQAHDLLDEMRLAGIRSSSYVYSSLLKAYCKENRTSEITSLIGDARRAGIQLNASSYEALIESHVLENDTQGALTVFKEMKVAKLPRNRHQETDFIEENETGLMSKLLHEIKEVQRVDYGVHDWNNVINFFCKKRLMQDAENALKKMMSLGHAPNAQTFHSIVTGYAAIGGKYIEVTELWGEMKAFALSSGMKFDQELLDAVLYTFVRGGFFVRALEVVETMEREHLFIDKYKYRVLFLKYHRTIYKGKTPKFQTESQLKKREAALDFKKWLGIC